MSDPPSAPPPLPARDAAEHDEDIDSGPLPEPPPRPRGSTTPGSPAVTPPAREDGRDLSRGHALAEHPPPEEEEATAIGRDRDAISNRGPDTAPQDVRQLYYKPSGTIPPAALFYALAYGAIGVAIFGTIFGLTLVYNPLRYIKGSRYIMIALPIIYGYLLSRPTWAGARRGHLRSPVVATFLGALVGGVGVYASWVSRIYFFSGGMLYTDLLAVIDELVIAYAEHDLSPLGAAYWLIEAILIVLCAAYYTEREAHDRPYCEDAEAWPELHFSRVRVGPTSDPEGLRKRLEAGDFVALPHFRDRSPKAYTRLALRICPGGEEGFFTAELITPSTGLLGFFVEGRVVVVRNLVVDAGSIKTINGLLARAIEITKQEAA